MGRLFTVVGINYYDYPENKNEIQEGATVYLKREPENKFDKNATIVFFNSLKIGYISAKETGYLFNDLENVSFNIYGFHKNVILIEEFLMPNKQPEPAIIEQQSILDTIKKHFNNLKKR